MIKLKYNGHANISLTKDNVTILIDPFFTDNPVNKTNPNEVECDYILVSHAHFDHIGDAIEISKRTGGIYQRSNIFKLGTLSVGWKWGRFPVERDFERIGTQ